jgi:hypothetical protein
MLDEQRGAEAFLDGLDMPGHGGVGGVQALAAVAGGRCAATREKPQVVPVEHAPPC